MSKTCIIDLDTQTIKRAVKNATAKGKSLRQVVSEAVKKLADSNPQKIWITERELKLEAWSPSRVALFNMRQRGDLVEGKHFKTRGRAIFWNQKELKKVFVKNG